MSHELTTAVVRRHLDDLAGDSPAEPLVRALLDRSGRHLRPKC
jgi:RNA polymerase sigma-70 factor (ECF subfamily)